MRSIGFTMSSAAVALALLVGGARPAPAADLRAAIVAVEAAEKDAAAVDAARAAAKAATDADPKSADAWVLAARVELAAGKRAKSDERKGLLQAALKALAEASAADRWNPEPFKWKALVLVEAKASNDEYVEALRAAAIRAAGEELTREKYRSQTGEIASLRVGDPMPPVTWKNSAGAEVKASDLYAKGPVIIELYRSAVWCAYCRRQLFAIDDAREKFAAEGISVVAISPDTAETIAGIEKNGLKERKNFGLRLLSDPEGRQADRLGVLNPDTVRKGTPPDAFGLPFPTTIIVDQTGTVRFVKTHGDFRERVKPEEMLAEARKLHVEVTPK